MKDSQYLPNIHGNIILLTVYHVNYAHIKYCVRLATAIDAQYNFREWVFNDKSSS